MLIWYHGIAMGLVFPCIPKKYKHSMYDVTIVDFAQIADLQWNIDQNWIFAKKVPNIGISSGFVLTKEGNDDSNI